jgi:hypothetical protein
MAIIWELDFYSRPILDQDGKKVWEVVICQKAELGQEPSSLFRYSQYCPSTQVNSLWLQQALKTAMAQAQDPPGQIRFFRRQMNNMISKTCKDLGLPFAISRRTITLHHWLQERHQTVYPQEPGYQGDAQSPAVQYGIGPSQPLPDELQGDRWRLVTLAAQDLGEMGEWDIGFGEAFALELVALEPDTPVPGLIVYSSRALPLAAWMSGLELGFLKFEPEPIPNLVLETGVSDRWILANLPNPALIAEAERFETTKQQANQVHFLAIQTNPQVEAFAGFWLLQELAL